MLFRHLYNVIMILCAHWVRHFNLYSNVYPPVNKHLRASPCFSMRLSVVKNSFPWLQRVAHFLLSMRTREASIQHQQHSQLSWFNLPVILPYLLVFVVRRWSIRYGILSWIPLDEYSQLLNFVFNFTSFWLGLLELIEYLLGASQIPPQCPDNIEK